eukprot:CAMPEP_0172500546 /NCGR_PEP_ID=MMETSP1066-20121228/139899_1 /TAXON_ID=671091 /ORGANISM="Coscinodiscus wailesii, Strain CCMP2513" /LENGTH=73 /DNA_ID=CAMNT_0013274835 /DNA_START=109 /DNA_END=330 /DNA_ORIENTATION=+
MALRRPPTRIELKADDIDEYDEIMRERDEANNNGCYSTGRLEKNKRSGGGNASSGRSARKMAAAKRIGISIER